MIIAPYVSGRGYDEYLSRVIKNIKHSQSEKNDDALIVLAGGTGSGKSSLMFHAYEEYDPETCTVEQVALTRADFACALKNASHNADPTRRFCANDEANVTRRDALTTYNKHLIDLYFSIRGLRIFHIWCNPSAEYMEKTFIEERVKGLIVVATKDIDRPRIYYYYRKKDLLLLLEREGNIKTRTLIKGAKKYAYYRGWFKEYKGKLWADYQDKKVDRMVEKVDDFYAEYGGEEKPTEWFKRSVVWRECGVSEATGYKYEKETLNTKRGVEQDIRREGVAWYHTRFVAAFKETTAEQRQKRTATLKGSRQIKVVKPIGASLSINARQKEKNEPEEEDE